VERGAQALRGQAVSYRDKRMYKHEGLGGLFQNLHRYGVLIGQEYKGSWCQHNIYGLFDVGGGGRYMARTYLGHT